MSAKKVIRLVVKLTLLEHILELVFAGLALGLMLSLIHWLSPYPVLMVAGTAAYVIGVVALYFFAVKRLKAALGDSDSGSDS